MPGDEPPLDYATHARSSGRCRAGGRRAGAADVSRRAQELDQGQVVAGERGRLAVDALLRERLLMSGAVRLAFGGDARMIRRVWRRQHVWVVDPIDGTRAYLAGRPDWAISAALVARGRPVVAALYAPVTRRNVLVRRPAAARRSMVRRSGRASARIWPARNSPVRNAASTLLRRSSPASKSCRGFTRWPCGSRAWPAASSTQPSPAPTAMIGTLRRRTFWCTKPAAR